MDIGNQIRVITVEPAVITQETEVAIPVVAEVQAQEEVTAAK